MKRIFLVLIAILVNFQNTTAQTTEKYIIKNLNSNQPYPDRGVALFDGDFVVFSAQIENTLGTHSRRRKRNKKKKITLLPQNLNYYFSAIDENGNFINSQKLGSVINSKYDDYGLAFSKDQSVVYFSREIVKKKSKETHLELFRADVISPGSWVNIKKLSVSLQNFSVGFPCLSEDDKTLYYVSDSEGNNNIYRVEIKLNGELGDSVKLNSNINTSYNETTPFIFNNKLFFSSNKPSGLGGYDIYSVDLNAKNSKPVRIDEPINSVSDDYFYVARNSKQGFFTSNRSGGKGNEDIYFFKEKEERVSEEVVVKNVKEQVPTVFNDEEDIVLAKNKIKKAAVLKQSQEERANLHLVNKNNKNIAIETKKETAILKEAKVLQESLNVVSENNKREIKEGRKNIVEKKVVETNSLVKNDNVYDYQRRDSYREEVVEGTVEIIKVRDNDIEVEKYKSKDEYSDCQMEFDRLSNIYFDYSESYIRADAAAELDKVIRVMRLCPKIKVVAASHTDSRASFNYNLGLSQKRSMKVVSYIIKNGKFSPDRIIGIGYGETRLTNGCSDGVRCTEKEHQLNRRTHFEIFNY